MNITRSFTVLSVFCVLVGCTAIDRQPAEKALADYEMPSAMYVDDVCVNITPGAAIETKSANAVYYTLVGDDGVTTYTLMVESEAADGLLYCNHYSEAGEYLATFVYHENELINVELSGEFAETKALLEGYRDCVKSTYREMRDKVQEDLTRECDLGLGMCDAASAVVALVKCTSAQNR